MYPESGEIGSGSITLLMCFFYFQSFDAEPKRNVVATAYRDKSWLPSVSLVDFIQKQKKVPAPVSRYRYTKNSKRLFGSAANPYVLIWVNLAKCKRACLYTGIKIVFLNCLFGPTIRGLTFVIVHPHLS